MVQVKEKKSFKKYASKHLAKTIENRRKGRQVIIEKRERLERKKKKQETEARVEEKEHRTQLERLKDQDPEFYSYLEEEDPTLLQYGQVDEEVVDAAAGDLGSDADTEVDEDEREAGANDSGEDDVTKEEALASDRVSKQELEEVLREKRVAPAIDIFVSAVRQLGYRVSEPPKFNGRRKFDHPGLVKEAIAAVTKLLGAQLPTLVTAKQKEVAFKSREIRSQVKRFLTAAVIIMSEGAESDGALAAQVAQVMASFVRVLHLIHGCTKSVLRAALALCAHSQESTRVAGYMVVLAVAKRASGTRSMYQSSVFKGLFLTLIKASHKYNIHQLPVVGFLMNAVADLYGTDLEAAYQHTYVYIRQLAVYLRSALVDQSQHSIRSVFNWQFLAALRTWGNVVSTYSEPNQLGALIHPIVQVATGLLDLFSSPRMFPMHLHVIEMLNHISSRSGVYIPVSTYILRILTSPAIALDTANKAEKANKKAADEVDLQFSMRVKKAHAKLQSYRVNVWTEALFLLIDHMAANSHSIGFPEAFWAVAATLRKLRREVKVPKVHSIITVALQRMDQTCGAITAAREKSSFGPCDLDQVKIFEDDMKTKGNPLVTYYNQMRNSRIEGFKAKQQNLKGRDTLEKAVERGGKGSRNRNTKRSREE